MIIDDVRICLLLRRQELEAGDVDEGLLHIPGRRNVLEGDFEAPAFARRDRRSCRSDYRARLAQGDLVHVVEKFDGHFHAAERTPAGVDEIAGKGGDLLVQEILGAAQADVFKLNL